MRVKKFFIFLTTLLLVTLAASISVSADQHSGTWKMNAAKSTFSPGPAPKSTTVKVDADENTVKVTADVTNADGTGIHVEYTAKFDGKDYPVTGNPNADLVSVKRLEGGAIESTSKKAGQVTITITSTVSKDGKSRTSVWKGKDAQGHEVNNVVVFDKQ